MDIKTKINGTTNSIKEWASNNKKTIIVTTATAAVCTTAYILYKNNVGNVAEMLHLPELGDADILESVEAIPVEEAATDVADVVKTIAEEA